MSTGNILSLLMLSSHTLHSDHPSRSAPLPAHFNKSPKMAATNRTLTCTPLAGLVHAPAPKTADEADLSAPESHVRI